MGIISEEPKNYKPIAQLMTRFSIPRLLKSPSSTSEGVIELLPKLVRAPRLASNLGRLNDESERKIYLNAGKIVIYNF